MPQRPYLAPGSLGDQVTYPKRFEKGDEVNALKALEEVGLQYLLQRGDRRNKTQGVKDEDGGLDGENSKGLPEGWLFECDWEDQLSGGEQQRLALSRVLFHRPSFAVLDECTSMVAADAEERLYHTVVSANITPITMSQRLFLPQLHSKELRLGVASPSKWSLVGHLELLFSRLETRCIWIFVLSFVEFGIHMHPGQAAKWQFLTFVKRV